MWRRKIRYSNKKRVLFLNSLKRDLFSFHLTCHKIDCKETAVMWRGIEIEYGLINYRSGTAATTTRVNRFKLRALGSSDHLTLRLIMCLLTQYLTLCPAQIYQFSCTIHISHHTFLFQCYLIGLKWRLKKG